jgi:hypothetical protein
MAMAMRKIENRKQIAENQKPKTKNQKPKTDPTL